MELRRVAPVVGLGALLLVDAVLIGWALRPGPAEVADAVTGVSVASPRGIATSPTPTASRSASPSASPSPSPAAVSVVPLTRTVAAVGRSIAWVADVGTCTKPGQVRVTSDRGASWSSDAAPAQVLRIRPDSGTAAFLTGGDSRCALRLWSTNDGAASWGGAQSASRAWSRMPDDPTTVHVPTNGVVAPCPGTAKVIDLTAVDVQTALVLCAGGQVRTTSDSGQSWRTAFSVKGALALALSPDASAGVLARVDKACAGVVVLPVRGSVVGTQQSCVRSTPASGRVAVAGSATSWWLVVGDDVFVAAAPEGPWSATKAGLGKG